MTEVIEIKPKGRYGASRHNAMKHGLKSEQMVLPWERQEDFEHLQKSLLDEYRPQNTTQRELVNMLFLTFWRMRRAGVAENAIIQNEYERLSSQSPDRTLRMGDDEIRKEIDNCANHLANIAQAEKLYSEHGAAAYEEIGGLLTEPYKMQFNKAVRDLPPAELHTRLMPFFKDTRDRIETHLRHLQDTPTRQRQAGYAAMFSHEGLERIGRYEASLRRGMTRILGLLHDQKTFENGDLIEG